MPGLRGLAAIVAAGLLLFAVSYWFFGRTDEPPRQQVQAAPQPRQLPADVVPPATQAAPAAELSIHKLSLQGIMRDSSADFALFSDERSGERFILRNGRLYDRRRKAVPGFVGAIEMKYKRVTLLTPEGDSEVFRLGRGK